jgi:hypothetical protein
MTIDTDVVAAVVISSDQRNPRMFRACHRFQLVIHLVWLMLHRLLRYWSLQLHLHLRRRGHISRPNLVDIDLPHRESIRVIVSNCGGIDPWAIRLAASRGDNVWVLKSFLATAASVLNTLNIYHTSRGQSMKPISSVLSNWLVLCPPIMNIGLFSCKNPWVRSLIARQSTVLAATESGRSLPNEIWLSRLSKDAQGAQNSILTMNLR